MVLDVSLQMHSGKMKESLACFLRINKLRLTICRLMTGTVAFILCESGRKVLTYLFYITTLCRINLNATHTRERNNNKGHFLNVVKTAK